MFCLFAATLECHAPWAWWMLLSETDQATWFGAWSAAAAFLGGLVVYWHGKRLERANEETRRIVSRRVQAAHIAGLLHGATERLATLRAVRKSPPVSGFQIRSLEIPNIEALQSALTDPFAFEGHQGAEFVAFLAALRKINRHLHDHAVEEFVSTGVIPVDEIAAAHEVALVQSERMWAITVGRTPAAAVQH